MNNLELLKLLLQEKKYPHFSDEELNGMLLNNDNDVYKTASELCLMKANGDKKIKIGPIEIEGPGAEYWITLSKEYLSKINADTSTNTGGYKNSMSRSDNR